MQMGYPSSFVFEELFAIWTSFEETGVGLKVFQDMSSVVESAIKTLPVAINAKHMIYDSPRLTN